MTVTTAGIPRLGPVDTRCVLGRALLLAVPGPTADTEQRDWSRVGILN